MRRCVRSESSGRDDPTHIELSEELVHTPVDVDVSSGGCVVGELVLDAVRREERGGEGEEKERRRGEEEERRRVVYVWERGEMCEERRRVRACVGERRERVRYTITHDRAVREL